MSEQLQVRRGTATQIAAFTGAAGEIVVDTTNNRAVVNDASTAGGWPAAKLAEVITNRNAPIGDAAYTVAVTDRTVAYTSLTAARIVSLPTAASYPTGTRLTIVDECGACSATKTLTINVNGTDTLNGASSAVLAVAYGALSLMSNGSTAWTIIDQPPGGPAGTLQVSIGGTGVAPRAAKYTVKATGVNANSVADTAIAIPLPTGVTSYRVAKVTGLNPSASLTAAQAGLYTAAGGGGTAICAAQALSGLTTNAANTAGNAADLTQANGATAFTATTLYFRITTAQGAAATLDVVVEIQPY